jgi:prepilin-type N-terminal cleavage/methylation domain-containing protein
MSKSKQGFTLIELMVVIVIIGVLASLAIPRFTEASDKAKAAEAPRIFASYESAYLAAMAEQGSVTAADQLIFKAPTTAESKWFTYTLASSAEKLEATNVSKLGKVAASTKLGSTYSTTANSGEGGFDRCGGTDYDKLIPNFKQNATSLTACGG